MCPASRGAVASLIGKPPKAPCRRRQDRAGLPGPANIDEKLAPSRFCARRGEHEVRPGVRVGILLAADDFAANRRHLVGLGRWLLFEAAGKLL